MSTEQEWQPCPPGELSSMVADMHRQQRRKALRTVAAASAVVVLGGLGVYAISGASSNSLTCAEVRPKLPAYVKDKLPRVERVQVAQHLEQCDHCRAKYEELL